MPNNEAAGVPEAYLTEIGRILVCWNSLEHLLDAALIVALTGHTQDPDGRVTAVVSQMGGDQKINALESILRLVDKNPRGMGDIFKETLRPLLQQSKERRNETVHHHWMGLNGIAHKSTIRTKGKLRVVSSKVQLKELTDISRLILKTRAELQNFCLDRLIPTVVLHK